MKQRRTYIVTVQDTEDKNHTFRKYVKGWDEQGAVNALLAASNLLEAQIKGVKHYFGYVPDSLIINP